MSQTSKISKEILKILRDKLPKNYNLKDINKAKQELMKIHHPDNSNIIDKKKATEFTQELNSSFDYIKEAYQRNINIFEFNLETYFTSQKESLKQVKNFTDYFKHLRNLNFDKEHLGRDFNAQEFELSKDYYNMLLSKGKSLALWATGKLAVTTGGIYGTYKYFSKNKDEENLNRELDEEFKQKFGHTKINQKDSPKRDDQIKPSLDTKPGQGIEEELEKTKLDEVFETFKSTSDQYASSSQSLGENNSFLNRIINKMNFKDSKLPDNPEAKYLLGIIIFTGMVYSSYKFFNKRSSSNTSKSPDKSIKKSPAKFDSFLTKTLKKFNLINSSPIKKSPLKSPKPPQKGSIFKKTLKKLKLIKESPK